MEFAVDWEEFSAKECSHMPTTFMNSGFMRDKEEEEKKIGRRGGEGETSWDFSFSGPA